MFRFFTIQAIKPSGGTAALFNFFFKGSRDNNYQEGDVKVGDRFYQVGGTESKWIVERLIKPLVSDVPHAVVVREGYEQNSKMVSFSALFDPTIFRPERRDEKEESVEKQNKARRRTDTKVSP